MSSYLSKKETFVLLSPPSTQALNRYQSDKWERLEEIGWSQRLCAGCWIVYLFSIIPALESVFMESVFNISNTKPPQRMRSCLFQSRLSANWGRSESRGCHSHSWPSKVPEKSDGTNLIESMTIAAEEVETVREFKRLLCTFCSCSAMIAMSCSFGLVVSFTYAHCRRWLLLHPLCSLCSTLHYRWAPVSWKPKKACQLTTLAD